jgi:L-iditol 2-dehydrogenase
MSIELKQDNPSVVLQRTGLITYEQRPVPEISEQNYVKIAITNTGLCGSDVHYYETGSCGSFKVTSPMVLGHESSGLIVEIGNDVKTLKVGDRVACEPGIPSRLSKEYKAGNYNLCPYMAFAATPPYDGTLCRYYLLPEDFCVKLPDHVSLEEGALVEPLSVGVHANRLIDVKFGDTMIIFGAGPIGLLSAGVAKAFGCDKVLIVDIIDDKLKFAIDNNLATHTFNSKNKTFDDLLAYIKTIWGNENLPTCGIDATGNKFCINMCIRSLEKKGRFVQVGMGGDNVDMFPISSVMERELTVKGSFRYSVDDYKFAVQLLNDRKINVKPLITHRFKFEEAIEAYEFSKQGKSIKIMIEGPK